MGWNQMRWGVNRQRDMCQTDLLVLECCLNVTMRSCSENAFLNLELLLVLECFLLLECFIVLQCILVPPQCGV